MAKKLFLLLLCLCLLLGGCRAVAPNAPDTPDTPAAQLQTNPEPKPETKPPARLRDTMTPYSEDGALFCVSLPDTELKDVVSMQEFAGGLLLVKQIFPEAADANRCDLLLTLLDSETGLVRAEAAIPNTTAVLLQPCGSGLALCDTEQGKAYYLDDSLTVCASWDIPASWDSCYLSFDRQTLYRCGWQTGLCAYSLQTGEETALLPDAQEVTAYTLCGTLLPLSYLDAQSGFYKSSVLDLQTGQISDYPISGSVLSPQQFGGTALAGNGIVPDLYLLQQEGAVRKLCQLEETSRLFLISEDRLLRITDLDEAGTQRLQLFDLSGTALASCTLPAAQDQIPLYQNPLCYSRAQDGCFFLRHQYDGSALMLFWDLQAGEASGEALALTEDESRQEGSGDETLQPLYARAAALSEEYGVQILIGEQCRTQYLTYRTESCTDPITIDYALRLLEQLFSEYPDGFFRQLYYGYYTSLEIDLTGQIFADDAPEDANGYTSFAAFVETDLDRKVMVLDILQGLSLRDNFYHEISHLIDAKLEFDSWSREDSVYSESGWLSLNPPDFSYVYDYYTIPEDAAQLWDGSDLYLYFIDDYSMTFPTEDRARVMEYACAGLDWAFADAPPLLEKLDYYCRSIRDGFDTTGWPEQTIWEQTLARCRAQG